MSDEKVVNHPVGRLLSSGQYLNALVVQVAEDVLGMEGVRCELKATSPGLGYMSYSFAAKLTGNYKQYNLFVKVILVYWHINFDST